MCENEVVYTDVKFTRGKGKADQSVSSSADTTYSDVKLLKTSTEPPGSRSKVTAERVVLLLLIVLLLAAVAGLVFDNMRTKKTLESLRMDSEREKKNLTEIISKMKPSSTETPTCQKPTILTPDQKCRKCETGWKKNKGKCYFFSAQKSNWTESKRLCQNKSGNLVKIDSRDEQRFLEKTLRSEMDEAEDKFWIGLTDSEQETHWLWVDGSVLNSSLTFWGRGEPDNWTGPEQLEKEGEDCVRMGEKNGADDLKCWFDRSCKEPHKFICEKTATDGVLEYKCV